MRDLVALKTLLDPGQRLEDLLALARENEGGGEPAMLEAFRRELVARLLRMAQPPS